MTPEERGQAPENNPECALEALAPPAPAVALHNAITLWAEHNTRPETLDRAAKLNPRQLPEGADVSLLGADATMLEPNMVPHLPEHRPLTRCGDGLRHRLASISEGELS